MENVFNQIYGNLIPGAQTIPTRYGNSLGCLWADFGLSIAAVGDDLLCPPSAQRISEYYFLFFLVWGWLWGGGGRRRIRRNRKALLHFSTFSFQIFSLNPTWPQGLTKSTS